MDPVVLTSYAVICGFLSVLAPWLGRPLSRLGIGALVGIVGAAVLPMVRAALGL